MKKIILVFYVAFLTSTNCYAWNQIPFTVGFKEDYSPIGNNQPKSPICLPEVYIEDLTLKFVVGHPEYLLKIFDEEKRVRFVVGNLELSL